MKPIATPVFSLAKDSIRNSFRTSGKRHIVLTGSRGSGKSTLLGKLFPDNLPGITTFAEPGKAVFLRENTTGMQAQVGVFDETIPGIENRMRLCPAGFEELGIPALERCLSEAGEWAAIDEIGYLEAGCPEYQEAVRKLMDHKRIIAAVRKQEIPFLREICAREDVFLIDLDALYGNAGCVIMASGLGVRFGGNKLMADFGGEPMIMRAIRATDGIFARRVVVTRHEDVYALCRENGIDAVLHDMPRRSDTVRIGIEKMEGMDGCLFCPGDQPLLRRETVSSIALLGANDREHILRACYGGTCGMPVMFPKWAFGELASLPEGKGGGYLMKKYPDRVMPVPAADEYELADADDREALDKLFLRFSGK